MTKTILLNYIKYVTKFLLLVDFSFLGKYRSFSQGSVLIFAFALERVFTSEDRG